MKHDPGIGATPDLSLRVSVATLVRVVFKHPLNGEWMLALERKATLHKDKVEVKSQPFGGAIRILDLHAIHDLIGDFHFDSERSRTEQDFRLFIRPSSWSAVREFCIEYFSRDNDPILETNPTRELSEEFYDALKVNLKSEQYDCMPISTLVENEAAPTENVHAKGILTVRVYRIFEAAILDSTLANTMLINSENNTDQNLHKLALDDFQNGGKGRANAVLALPLKNLCTAYLTPSPKDRNASILFEENRLDKTVSAVLDGISVPKHQKV